MEKEKSIKGINELKNFLGLNENSETTDLKDIKLRALEKTIDLFFKIDDKHGFTKTDIERHLVFPITVMYDYVDNLLPLYNIHLRKKNKTKKLFEKNKIACPEISEIITEIYIKILVSKSRLGRSEGTQISKSLYESLKDSIEKSESGNFGKTINDLTK